MKTPGIAIRILGLLATTNFPGLTRGEIRNALGLPSDTEITARVRELRRWASYGNFDVRVDQSGREYRYYMLPGERRRACLFLQGKKVAA
jgi:hypothetical protein